MSLRTLLRAFSAGELTPELFGRVDFAKFQEGLALCKNFITLPHGPAVNRPGTQYVATVKNLAVVTRLIPFSYNNTQTFAIQLGAGYFRFHTNAANLQYTTPAAYNGATAYTIGSMVSSAGVNYYCIAATTGNAPPNATYWYALPADMTYEIPNNYAAADLMDIHFVQSADVLTLVHPNYPVTELRRYGATNWQLAYPVFNPPACQLTGVTATATVGTGATVYSYVVTGILSSTQEETVASAVATVSNDLTTTPNRNTVTWTDSSPAGTYVRYNVYKLSNGIYGYIGQAGTPSFVDQFITADISKAPPIYDAVFNSAGNYPAAVSYFEQRRCFAGTANAPQNLWMTRSGTESNMSYSIPVKDDNRIAVRVAAREASAIRHIVPVTTMLILTASCEWRASSTSGAITPTTIDIKPQSYNGANNVTPVVVNNLVLYASARGGHMRELSYSWQANGYIASDVSLLAPHLFDYYTINDMSYSRGPIPILWAVSSSGKLLGLTYVPEQQVGAWHQHTTGMNDADKFESVCVITENNEDMLYCIVNRTLNGVQTRCVERLHTRLYATLSDAFYVDCGATYSGAATTTVSGLTWLNGVSVSVLADGAVIPPQVVTGGTITLPAAASTITVGIPITAQIQTMPLAGQVDPAMGQGKTKNVNRVWLRVYRSSGIFVGPDFNTLTPFKQRTTENYGSPPAMVSDEIEVALTPTWGRSGQICIQQTDPLPLDIAAMTIEVALGGG